MAQGLRSLRSLFTPAGPSSRIHQIRNISIAPGEREKALLEEDSALKHFKSSKETARRVKRLGDVLVILVSAGCIYQIYDVTRERRAERLGKNQE